MIPDEDPNFGGVDAPIPSYGGVPTSQARSVDKPSPLRVRAKFRVVSVEDTGETKHVKLIAATGPGNESWSRWTPAGTIQMSITNPAASSQFKPGDDFELEFTKV